MRNGRRCAFPGALSALPRTLALCGVNRHGGRGFHGLGLQCHALEHTPESPLSPIAAVRATASSASGPSMQSHACTSWTIHMAPRPPSPTPALQPSPSTGLPSALCARYGEDGDQRNASQQRRGVRMGTRYLALLLLALSAAPPACLACWMAASTGSTDVKLIRPFYFGSPSGGCSVMTKMGT